MCERNRQRESVCVCAYLRMRRWVCVSEEAPKVVVCPTLKRGQGTEKKENEALQATELKSEWKRCKCGLTKKNGFLFSAGMKSSSVAYVGRPKGRDKIISSR